MNETKLHPLAPLRETPASGEFLLLVEPERVPPHLAWVKDARYYALSVKGVECGKSLESFLRAMERKDKELLMMEVCLSADDRSLDERFSRFAEGGVLENSCLAPIRERCGFGADEGVRTVHDLIAELQESGQLRSPYLYRSSRPIPQSLWIPAYEAADVEAYLKRYRGEAEE